MPCVNPYQCDLLAKNTLSFHQCSYGFWWARETAQRAGTHVLYVRGHSPIISTTWSPCTPSSHPWILCGGVTPEHNCMWHLHRRKQQCLERHCCMTLRRLRLFQVGEGVCPYKKNMLHMYSEISGLPKFTLLTNSREEIECRWASRWALLQ